MAKKKTEIQKISDIVESVLKDHAATRDSDDLLYAEVCKILNPGISEYGFISVMVNRNMFAIPCYGTVCRCRRKMQELHKGLRGTITVQQKREQKKREYLAYVKSAV